MKFTDTDFVWREVIGQIHWKTIYTPTYRQVNEQVCKHLDQQIKPMQNTIKQEIRK